MAKPRSKRLTAKVSRDGVLTVEIGIDTLVTAALASPIAWTMHGGESDVPFNRPTERFSISNARGFAREVAEELLAELGEDGSTLLTNALDEAFRRVVESGSQFFIDSKEAE